MNEIPEVWLHRFLALLYLTEFRRAHKIVRSSIHIENTLSDLYQSSEIMTFFQQIFAKTIFLDCVHMGYANAANWGYP